jgi:2-oxoisovalerate dehydrogenase E1 component
MFEAAGQLVLQASKLRYMSNGQMNAPMVVRVGVGSMRSAGPHHSGTYHPVWAHIPGLIVCIPATPADAKGLMKTALRAGDPVMMLEPKALFASKGEVAIGDYLIPFGVARMARIGRDLTIVSAGQLVHRSVEAAEVLAGEGIEIEVIDLRTIMPLDVETVAASVRKTHRLLIADEAYAAFGLGAELAQAMNELAFDDLDGPVGRVHTHAVSHPLAPALEGAIVVDTARIVAAARDVLRGEAPIPQHWRGRAGRATPVPFAAAKTNVPPAASVLRPAMPDAGEGEPITMPFGDLTVSEGKIVRWLKTAGDPVKAGELVAEIETDKAVVEIEAPVDGRLGPIEQPVGAVVPMGGRIGAVVPKKG